MICGEAFFRCRCHREGGHDGSHRCEPACGGSWLPNPEAEHGVEIIAETSGVALPPYPDPDYTKPADVGNPYKETTDA